MRPDKKSAKKAIYAISLIKKKLTKIIESESHIKDAIAKESPNLRQDSALAELALMDVEVINADKQGIRVSALRNARITNMAELCQMPLQRIKAINGIGEHTAVKIKSISNKMYAVVAESAKMQIDPTKRLICQNIVVKNLHLYLHGEEIRKTVHSLMTNDVKTALIEARPASGMLRWFFASGKKTFYGNDL